MFIMFWFSLSESVAECSAMTEVEIEARCQELRVLSRQEGMSSGLEVFSHAQRLSQE